MLRSLKRLLARRPASVDDMLAYPGGKRFYREQHELRRENMDPDALKVVNRLNRGGYRSYLVGGCVRDMLLGGRPKDFDVVTSATPAQIRNLFSNSRAIGRRFKIVHVVFRGKVIEVSTFRSLPEHRLRGSSKKAELIMHRDNEFGSPREDAARRDFTINALFFDPRNESIIDYVGGFQDVQNKQIRIIGDPDISFQEDPVRMLRATKFTALHGLEMDAECTKAIKRNAGEIAKASPSRMLEEYGKIFRTGKTSLVFESFAEAGLLKALLPEVWSARRGPDKKKPFPATRLGRRLATADKVLREREDLTIVIYFALLFTDILRKVVEGKLEKNVVDYIKQQIGPVCKRIQLPGKDRDRLGQIFAAQHRFKDTEARRRFKPEFFRQKAFFYEAFMVYKIIAIARKDEEAMQKAMFWEIGPRVKPPEGGKTITLFEKRRRGPRPDSKDRSRGGRSGRERSKKDRPKKDRPRQDSPKAKASKDTSDSTEESGSEKKTGRRRRGRRRSPRKENSGTGGSSS